MKRPTWNPVNELDWKWKEYADHLEQEIERLKAEQIELVKYCMNTEMGWHSISDSEAEEVYEQFKQQKKWITQSKC